MANDKSKAGQAAGQQKVHTATRVNPDTGETESKDFDQAAWRARDKSEGWTRPEGDEEGGETGGGETPIDPETGSGGSGA